MKKKKEKSKIYRILSSFNMMKWSVAGKGLIVGLVAGLLAAFYRMLIEYGTKFATEMYAYFFEHPIYIAVWIVAAAAVGIFIAWLVKREPMATGSGIPQIEGVVLYDMKMKWYTILPVRFIAGGLCGFFGLSLGREGPSIQIGASGGQAVAKTMGKSDVEENILITSGAAAGLSAAFNAPLSGMMFAMEEVHHSFSPMIMLSAITASLVSDFVAKYFFGLNPVLNFTTVVAFPISMYWWVIPLGIISGLAGVAMNRSLLGFKTIYSKMPWFIRPTVALLIALPCGMFFPLTLGSGQNLIKYAESATAGLDMILLLMVMKLVFTSTSFGSGVPGGIFMPILAVGTLAGSAMGILSSSYLGISAVYIPTFAICAMAGALAASVKAPITAILLTVEMSGKLVHMFPIAACTFIALLVSDLLKTKPVYEALLDRFAAQYGTEIPIEEKGGLIETPIEIGSSAAGQKIKDIDWPKGCLVVALHRGDKDIVPSGEARIMPGDFITIVSSSEAKVNIKEYVKKICSPSAGT